MRLQLLGFVGLVSLAALGCGASGAGKLEGAGGAGGGGTGGGGGSSADVPASGDMPSGSSQNPGSAGVLTAGDWDDNLNFGFWQKYRQHAALSGLDKIDYETGDRVEIHVSTSDGKPVSAAQVVVLSGAMPLFSGPTGSDGRVLFFPSHDGAPVGTVTVHVEPPPDQAGLVPLTTTPSQGPTWDFVLAGAEQKKVKALDLAFVVDTTGSMGDEIGYLQKELSGIVADVHTQFQDVSVHLALIVYRDVGDEYVVKSFDFTDSVEEAQKNIDAQGADGGGDTPEAMEQGLAELSQLHWRSGNVARMAVLVADAPPHDEHAQEAVDVFDELRPQGIKLYPLAASGVDETAEFLMRLGAESTGGRYMFLTDDSGVGGPHKDPTIPCYQVRKLRDVLVYEIQSELSGERASVPDSLVIRDVGDPSDGVCKLQDGSAVYLW